ncbi:MAG: Hsp20/alpha crystallin family protein [Deltaproteobacteria bacterium]|nr:Hsp20/alpha crystallin family protein [Deltaproteobacteria bacterium]
MLTRWDDVDRMFQAMDVFRNRMNRLFTDFDRGLGLMPDQAAIAGWPRTNLYDAGDHLEVRVELPGITVQDLNVKVLGNSLEISGERKSLTPEGYSVHRLERGEAGFSRRFTLPVEVQADQVEAILQNGILSLRLPKAESARPRKIEIKTE